MSYCDMEEKTFLLCFLAAGTHFLAVETQIGITNATTCDKTWITVLGLYCLKDFPGPLTWMGARKNCQTFGADLVSFQGLHMQAVITASIAMATKNPGYWVGANDRENEGIWKWSDGRPWSTDAQWNRNQPDDSGGVEDCGMIVREGKRNEFFLNDFNCNNTIPYVCMKLGCNDGRYGFDCAKVCGRCANQASCHMETGQCPNGCDVGVLGDFLCQTECPNGRYGWNCSSICGQCTNNTTCARDTGHCPEEQCVEGKEPPFCSECLDGRYGIDCTDVCGRCKGKSPCHKNTGVCVDGCDIGVVDDKLCQTECPNGTYGWNCSFTCGLCLNNATCRKDHGHCPGGCLKERLPPLCQDTLSSNDVKSSYVPWLVGGLAFLIVLFVVMLTGYLVWRRQHQKIPDRYEDMRHTDTNEHKYLRINSDGSSASATAGNTSRRDSGCGLSGSERLASVFNQEYDYALSDVVVGPTKTKENFLRLYRHWMATNSTKNKTNLQICYESFKRGYQASNFQGELMKGRTGSDVPAAVDNPTFIPAFGSAKAYLLTEFKFEDESFWKMVYQNKVQAIVAFEKSTWTSQKQPNVIGQYRVACIQATDKPGFTAMTIQLSTGKKTRQHRDIHIFTFHGWNNHVCVPLNLMEYLCLYDDIKCFVTSVTKTPLMVCCGMTTDRAKLFITTTNVLRDMETSGIVDIIDVARKMRINKLDVIENYEQFKFVHDLVYHYIQETSHGQRINKESAVYEYVL